MPLPPSFEHVNGGQERTTTEATRAVTLALATSPDDSDRIPHHRQRRRLIFAAHARRRIGQETPTPSPISKNASLHSQNPRVDEQRNPFRDKLSFPPPHALRAKGRRDLERKTHPIESDRHKTEQEYYILCKSPCRLFLAGFRGNSLGLAHSTSCQNQGWI